MNEPQQGMSDEFKSRMRQGLSTMAVRERVRERARNRAIAGGALAAVVVATMAVFGSQALGQLSSERDQAGPATTQTATSTAGAPTPAPTETEPTETEPSAASPPPGFEGVAAGEPLVTDVSSCTECGDTGAAGGGTPLERVFDVYLVCEGSGSVRYGGELWIDCSEHAPGTGFVELGQPDYYDDGDPLFTPSSDFDGQLSVVDAGQAPSGSGAGSTATVWVTCFGETGTVTIGDALFDCASAVPPEGETLTGSIMAAWGVPILPGEIAPRIQSDRSAVVQVSFVVDP